MADPLQSVTSYNPKTACLLLGHLYPKDTNVVVAVNVELVLETMSSEITRVGEWVNVIGYLGNADAEPSMRADAYVRALAIWSTGPMDIQQYERAIEEGSLG